MMKSIKFMAVIAAIASAFISTAALSDNAANPSGKANVTQAAGANVAAAKESKPAMKHARKHRHHNAAGKGHHGKAHHKAS